MGLTPEQKDERNNDKNVGYIKDRICKANGDKSYVFISYKSDDWKVVLHDIVYRLVKDYGLNVYFDGAFDDHNDNWIKQFPKNMKNGKCKGVLAFVNDKYATSYATLLELMYSQGGCQDEDNNLEFVEKKVVPVFLVEKLTKITDKSDTGLGMKVYEDETKNEHATKEKGLFNSTFRKICRREYDPIFIKSESPYDEEKKLSKQLCSVMVEELLDHINASNNYYLKPNGSLEAIVKTIKDACGDEVFSDVVEQLEQPEPPKPTVEWDFDKSFYYDNERGRVVVFISQEYNTRVGRVTVFFGGYSFHNEAFAFLWADDSGTDDEYLYNANDLIDKASEEDWEDDIAFDAFPEYIPIAKKDDVVNKEKDDVVNKENVEKYGLEKYVDDILARIDDIRAHS